MRKKGAKTEKELKRSTENDANQNGDQKIEE